VYVFDVSKHGPHPVDNTTINPQHRCLGHSQEGYGLSWSPTVAAQLLERQRLTVVPGSPRWFGQRAAGHLCLCFATSAGVLAEGLERLAAGLAEAANGRG
jgi:hypothetical protein